MSSLVEREVAGCETVGEERGLLEGEAEAFSGDGVDSAGGIAYQSDSVSINAPEAASDSNRSAFGRCVRSVLKACGEFGKLRQRFFEAQFWAGGNQRDANFVATDGRYVDLAVVIFIFIFIFTDAPVQFHELSPGSDTVVAAEGEAAIFLDSSLRAGRI